MAETRRKTAVERAADRLREDILTGRYAIGDRLPGERDLSATLGVSRLTLRSALTRLEAEGIVRSVHGSGNLVTDYRETGGIGLLGHLSALALSGHEAVPLSTLGEVLEMRRAISVEALGLATERCTPEVLRALRRQVMSMRDHLTDPRRFMEADLLFARHVVRATQNIGYELVFNTVQRATHDNPALELAYFANAPRTVEVYDRLIELMEKGDPRRVRDLASRLLSRLDRQTLRAIGAPEQRA